MDITIIENTGLSQRVAQINQNTYNSIIIAKGNSAFFPNGLPAIGVGEDPFDPDYILFIVANDLPDNVMFVSSDVKARHYANRTTLTF
jgi:hypothetical protein